jgi:hypothetical protein
VLTAGLLAGCVASSFAMKEIPVDRSELTEWQSLAQIDQEGAAAHSDTAYFGGNGTGNGTVVRGGVWNFEANSGEAPQFFNDGDPVGNQFRDGWTFIDRTTRVGPSQYGSPHWNNLGVYNFNYDALPGTAAQGSLRPGGYAHRTTTHANNGINDGPNPLQGSWSLWIGTNLELNPENCHWTQTSGYGDGWAQGIQKSYAIPAGHQGADINVNFFHRYAVEAGFDTCWVEISFDGDFWDAVGTAGDQNGIFNDGDFNQPLPSAAGGAETTILVDNLGTNAATTLHVRFILRADAFFSDSGDGGNFRWAWMLDNIQTQMIEGANTTNLDAVSTFETDLGGWQISSFEGFDFAITTDATRPAGRIVALSTLGCPPIVACPEACGIDNRILMFSDKDDCDLVDDFQDSYIVSRAFAIGGPTLPDLDGDAGRIIRFDLYTDGGAAGTFNTGNSFCWAYWPFNSVRCPFSPAAGHPGAGLGPYNWSQESTASCDFFSQGSGTDCFDNAVDNISAQLPADADSAILQVGAFSQCRGTAGCDVNDNGTPFYDNLQFGVFDPAGITVSSVTLERYSDNFPTANGSFLTQTARQDGAHNFASQLGNETPQRFCRADSAAATTGAANTAVFLRFAVERSACQPNLAHPFFTAYAPSAPGSFPNMTWHAARMDTGRSQGGGNNVAGSYMTCYHESDPRNGTFWTGAPPAVEPCDDILPDGLFIGGTSVYYFFEARNATTGAVLGTFPEARNGAPIKTTPNYKDFWLESSTLPELASNCDGSLANNMLVVSDYQSAGVPGRATTQRERLVSTLASLGLEFDVYDTVGTNFTNQYNTIGRREDRVSQAPRPPFNGATDTQLGNYDCIWYQGGLLTTAVTLSDLTSDPDHLGQPSKDQQSLETWLGGCTAGNNRLLVLEGIGWASDIQNNTTHGPAFLTARGVSVLADDYAQDLAADDLRRCARIVGQAPAAGFDGEIFGSGCPDNLDIDVIAAVNGGEAVANFVESLEDGDDPVNCADDQNRAPWHAVVRRATGASNCQRSVAMSFSFSELYPLNCTDQCLFDDYRINGENAQLVVNLFNWAGCPINPAPIGVDDPAGAPRFANELYQAQPNPANPSAMIRYTIAQKGQVQLRIFDVSGRLVRTLVDKVQEPAETAYEAVWDGTNDQGQKVGSGVFFYQIDAPSFSSSKKLVILK